VFYIDKIIVLIDVKIQDDKNTGRWSIRHSLQSNKHQNRRNRRHQKNEAEVLELERMHRTKRDKIPAKTQSLKHNKIKGSSIGLLRTLHGLRISGL